ncbi:MAG: hypothetical protein ACE5Z5_13885 [Candidatus Bathyarchaeia archaeon]
MPRDTDIKEYKRLLAEKIREGDVRCPKCGNKEDFMVNEIGHVFCNRCFTKIPMIRLDDKR